MVDVFLEALLDSLKMLPFLFAAYLFIEYLEHKASDKMRVGLQRLGPLGPVGGAALGIVPQCGFSVTAANFYAGRIITLGTLFAVFLSTSDEAIPILLSHPEALHYLWPMLLIKLISAVLFGVLVDAVMKYVLKQKETVRFDTLCKDCDCEHGGILRPALRHTVHIFLFVLLTNLVLGLAIHFVGEEQLSALLLGDSIFQPFLTALIGLIPNCAASVLITELFVAGSLQFGSCVAGLCAGAGVGLAVLFRMNKNLKENLTILGLLYAASVFTGLIVNLFIR